MCILQHNPLAVAMVLRNRPYHPRRYLPLATFLVGRGYRAADRERAVELMGQGAFLESLVVDGTIRAEDEPGAREALAEGLDWYRRYQAAREALRDAEIVPPELEPDEPWSDPTADADGDPIGEIDDRVRPLTTLDVEPFHPGEDGEPYEPTEADREEYARWSEAESAIEAMRDWYRTRPTFEQWLESCGGPDR